MLTYDKLKAKYDLYLAALEQRLKNNPHDREALIHRAVMLYDFYQEPDEAAAILQSIVDKDPNCVDAYLWIGEFERFFTGDFDKAVEYLKQAVAIDPNRADCHALLAGVIAEFKATDPKEVEYHYRKSFELEPTFINPRFYLAYYFWKLGKFGEARHELEEALKYVADGEWPTNNPVEEYYEDMITGRLSSNRRQEILDFIQKIDAAESATKMEPDEA